MATEKLNLSGWDSGWPTGFISNADEPIASADGQTISTIIEDDVVLLDLDNVSTILDSDTVAGVTVTVRCNATSSIPTPSLDVEFLVGSVSQGTVAITLTETMTNHVCLDVGAWDADWIVSQLNSAQLRITARKVSSEATAWHIDCVDVDVLYASPFEPPAGTLTLTGKLPQAVPLGDNISIDPGGIAVGNAVLSGQAPSVSTGFIVDAGAATLRGKVSYVNSLQTQLQVSGWDSGWPTGFVSNIDDTTAVPDGQTISTTISSDVVLLDLDDVTGTIVPTDDVVSVTGVFRGSSPAPSGGLLVELMLSGVAQASTSLTLSETLQNYNLFTTTAVGEGWTIAQLNSMQLRVTTTGSGEWFIDAIDVVVEYTPQSPINKYPGAGSLALSTSAPTLFREYIGSPAAATPTLTGAAPTLFRQDTYYPDERFLLLTGQAPTLRTNYIELPLIGSLALSLKTNSSTTNHLALPAAVALTLTGKVPVPDYAANHWRDPASYGLRIIEYNVLALDEAEAAFDPPQGPLSFTGKVPVLVPTEYIYKEPATSTLALSGSAPTVATSYPVGAAALSLTGSAPVARYNTDRSPGVGGEVMTGHVPLLRFGDNPVLLPAAYGLRVFTFQGLQLLNHGVTTTTTADHWRDPATATLVFAPENPAPQTSNTLVIPVPRTQLVLAGQVPTFQHTLSAIPGAIALALSGTVPGAITANYYIPGRVQLSLLGYIYNFEAVDNRVVDEGSLALASTAPSFSITSSLVTGGQPGLVGLSVDYDIEFIATPTTILLP